MSMRLFILALILTLTAGCGFFSATGPESNADPTFAPVPTFTPTPEDAATSQPTAAQTAAVTMADNTPAATTEPAEVPTAQATEAPSEEIALAEESLLPTPTREDADPASASAPEAATETPATAVVPSGPSLIVNGDVINVRQGPGIEYVTVGTAAAGQSFTPIGRDAAGEWWQVCCFGDDPGWLFGGLVTVEGADDVATATDIPAAPTATPVPAPVAVAPTAAPAEEAAPPVQSGTAGNFDPAAQYHIVGYRVIGYGENNGGIFNNGGQHMIFIKVIDGAGNGIDGAVVKNAINDNITIVTGSKGPGKAEFEMFWDPYKLYVASDPSGPVTSQITNQMNTAYPHVPDVIGRLGPPDEEYAICPTPDDRCEPPFYHAHWSYEVVFQKVQ